ncbi:hypothetical protein F5884DRAFT_784219 [Xylogone sp. PMI_703]|nr:hypothetical protein F5884DRAFT_784219 [Xylogone sp. PMI_703]
MNFRPLNQKPNIFKFESPISQRLPGFLEKMAAANSQLQADIDAGKSADHRLEISSESESESESDSDADSDDSSEDDDSNDANDNEDGKHSQSKEEASLDSSAKSGGRKKRQYIEMNLALGVLEEKKDASDIKFRPDDDDSSSTSSSDESIMIVPRERVIKKATGTKGKKLITEV